MEKIKIMFARVKIFKVLAWVFLILLGLFIILIIGRLIFLSNLEKTNVQVEKIHATKITLDDVMGKNLPAEPGTETDKTIIGIDANENGIRDDVENAIFKEYPNSAKTRAALLQYALALQMEVIQPMANTMTATEVVREQSRGFQCIGEILYRNDDNKKVMDKYFEDGSNLRSFVKQKQFNTEERIVARDIFLKEVRSYSDLDPTCDIDYSKLSN